MNRRKETVETPRAPELLPSTGYEDVLDSIYELLENPRVQTLQLHGHDPDRDELVQAIYEKHARTLGIEPRERVFFFHYKTKQNEKHSMHSIAVALKKTVLQCVNEDIAYIRKKTGVLKSHYATHLETYLGIKATLLNVPDTHEHLLYHLVTCIRKLEYRFRGKFMYIFQDVSSNFLQKETNEMNEWTHFLYQLDTLGTDIHTHSLVVLLEKSSGLQQDNYAQFYAKGDIKTRQKVEWHTVHSELPRLNIKTLDSVQQEVFRELSIQDKLFLNWFAYTYCQGSVSCTRKQYQLLKQLGGNTSHSLAEVFLHHKSTFDRDLERQHTTINTKRPLIQNHGYRGTINPERYFKLSPSLSKKFQERFDALFSTYRYIPIKLLYGFISEFTYEHDIEGGGDESYTTMVFDTLILQGMIRPVANSSTEKNEQPQYQHELPFDATVIQQDRYQRTIKDRYLLVTATQDYTAKHQHALDILVEGNKKLGYKVDEWYSECLYHLFAVFIASRDTQQLVKNFKEILHVVDNNSSYIQKMNRQLSADNELQMMYELTIQQLNQKDREDFAALLNNR